MSNHVLIKNAAAAVKDGDAEWCSRNALELAKELVARDLRARELNDSLAGTCSWLSAAISGALTDADVENLKRNLTLWRGMLGEERTNAPPYSELVVVLDEITAELERWISAHNAVRASGKPWRLIFPLPARLVDRTLKIIARAKKESA